MKYRKLGKTGINVSEISLGTWQVGGKWGSGFDMKNAERIIHTAIDQGINFIDTADVYETGQSEKAVASVVKKRSEDVYIATKAGRKLNPHKAEGYNEVNMEKFIDDSLKNMNLECIDIIQLHCPPTEVYYDGKIFEVLDNIKNKGKIKHYGVSVEKVEEALKAIEYPGVETVQIIFNMFRHKPIDEFFNKIDKDRVGILARVPLASGLLTGKFTKKTKFEKGDHRFFNRKGMFFDKGETFSGIDYQKGLEAVEKLKSIFSTENELHKYAIRWILMFDKVSCVIPGASKPEQVTSNLEAGKLPDLSSHQMQKVAEVYNEYFKDNIHHLW